MGKSDDKIVECAIAIISRYGYKKTTMADLAEAAGVSRQTLYNKFPNKEEVLRAAVRYGAEAGIREIRARWAEHSSVAEKLDIFFEIGPLNWYDTLVASPDSADLLEGMNTHAADVMEDSIAGWITVLAEMFEPHDALLEAKETSPELLADFVYTASSSAKYNATSRDQLVKRLATLKVAVLATLKE